MFIINFVPKAKKSNCTTKKHGKSPNFKRYDDRSREWLWKQATGWGIVDAEVDVNTDESCDDDNADINEANSIYGESNEEKAYLIFVSFGTPPHYLGL